MQLVKKRSFWLVILTAAVLSALIFVLALPVLSFTLVWGVPMLLMSCITVWGVSHTLYNHLEGRMTKELMSSGILFFTLSGLLHIVWLWISYSAWLCIAIHLALALTLWWQHRQSPD